MSDRLTVPPAPSETPEPRTRRLLVRALVIAGSGLAVTGSIALIAMGHGGPWWSGFAGFLMLLSILFAVFTWMVYPRQPRNVVVWLAGAGSFFAGVYVMGLVAAVWWVDDTNLVDALVGPEPVIPADLPARVAWLLAVCNATVVLTLFSWLTFGLLLFPDGKLPSSHKDVLFTGRGSVRMRTVWRRVAWYAAAANLLAGLGVGWSYRPSNTGPSEVGMLIDLGFVLVAVAVGLSLAALAGRFRRSRGVARQPFKWIMWGAVIAVSAQTVAIVFGGSRYNDLGVAILIVGTAFFALAYGIAIGKYRLFDVDVVISRSVAYVLVAAVVGALYGGAVLGYIWLFGDEDQRGGDLGVALPLGATVLVAVVFEPIRQRLQRLANRLVYGRRAAPTEVLSRLTTQLTDTSTTQGLDGLARLLREGTGAETAAVWLRVGDRFRVEATAPDHARRSLQLAHYLALRFRTDTAGDRDEPALGDFDLGRYSSRSETVLAVPVRHGGEILGALEITKARTHPVNPADTALLADVAAGAVLLLRNLRLNAELAERAEQLQASRRRLIVAHDSARRRLERNLHDGAQQQVVALKVKLGLAQAIADREGATDLAARIATLAEGTQDAIDAMRAVARGIYPPLLGAEGLGPALAAAGRSAQPSFATTAHSIDRYPQPLEETVYFCVMSAIKRAEMAGATRASVNLRGDSAALGVEVVFDALTGITELTALRDRVDAFRGTLAVDTAPGRTEIRMELPAAPQILEPA